MNIVERIAAHLEKVVDRIDEVADKTVKIYREGGVNAVAKAINDKLADNLNYSRELLDKMHREHAENQNAPDHNIEIPVHGASEKNSDLNVDTPVAKKVAARTVTAKKVAAKKAPAKKSSKAVKTTEVSVTPGKSRKTTPTVIHVDDREMDGSLTSPEAARRRGKALEKNVEQEVIKQKNQVAPDVRESIMSAAKGLHGVGAMSDKELQKLDSLTGEKPARKTATRKTPAAKKAPVRKVTKKTIN